MQAAHEPTDVGQAVATDGESGGLPAECEDGGILGWEGGLTTRTRENHQPAPGDLNGRPLVYA